MSVLRTVGGLVLVAACVAVAFAAAGAGGDGGAPRYFVEMDNAFGLVEGGDVKIAGVRAGTVETIDLQRKGMRARITVEVTDRGFGDLRADATCEARPQSLLGEYFLDCDPGRSPRRMRSGETIPVERTAGTVPLDLIQDIMRRPYRERWSIFLSELGAGLSARGDDLNETIRRANPALRETDKVLEALAEEREVIRDLYRDADEVLVRLRSRKEDMGRFFAEARDTARASAREERALARQFELLPVFLRELRPTMRRLRAASAAQRPALSKLSAQAPVLTRLLDAVGPFSDASRPGVRALARAARTGRPAVRDARGPVKTLRGAARGLPESATNLAFILQHLDDPAFAAEKDERAGRGKDGGFTGLEAVLRYMWSQSQAINVYNEGSYHLKVALFFDNACGAYANAERAKDPANARCRAWLGPNQPGVTTPDPTKAYEEENPPARTRKRSRERRRAVTERPAAAAPVLTPAPEKPATPSERPAAPAVPLPEVLQDLIDRAVGPDVPAPNLRAQEQASLLDFLMAP